MNKSNINNLTQTEIDLITGGNLFANSGSYLGLTAGIIVGTVATNYCARTPKGIATKILVMLLSTSSGTLIGKAIFDKYTQETTNV